MAQRGDGTPEYRESKRERGRVYRVVMAAAAHNTRAFSRGAAMMIELIISFDCVRVV